MRIVVTGAAGFIGSTLVKKLLQNDAVEVVGIDCFTDYYDPGHKRRAVADIVSPRFTLVEDDLATADLGRLIESATVIFHQAGQPGVRKSWGQGFQEYTTQNVDVTQRLLEAAKEATELEAFVYASSSSVYGDAISFPTKESDLPRPKSPYGVTKLAGEHLVSLYAQNFGLPTISLRYFTVYGPGQRPDMAFHKFIRAGLAGTSISVYGDGEQIREFTHVDDIVNANILASKAKAVPGTVVNLSGGSSVSVNQTLKIIERECERALTVEYLPSVNGDALRTGGSTEMARDLLGWKPTVSIEDGIKSEVDWLRAVMAAGN